MALDEAVDRLRRYMLAKKHQLQADRALRIIIDCRANIDFVMYDNRRPGESDELDDLVNKLGLLPANRLGSPSPPSVRRAKHRLRGRKPKKKGNR
ncbi:hypothetical protein [Actinoplanes sp. NBRC 103695]|uniref:hypothetical protein n=1 Tax=Actinoplanes sp. NBRC 103695 TaxID=3032202 RepID=UPI0024A216E2|nr:hypothetical protein [Actinoplanes sp. NBRC 103695]GLY96784.1 hypothetical protein Acsp02_40380 [Actinoplanes sp. NBRC 103695]